MSTGLIAILLSRMLSEKVRTVQKIGSRVSTLDPMAKVLVLNVQLPASDWCCCSMHEMCGGFDFVTWVVSLVSFEAGRLVQWPGAGSDE